MPDAPWRVFGTKAFFRLWVAQCVSSLGDWIGLIAILAIAARVSDNSGAAVSLVMTTRVLPGFLLGTVGGVIIDRFDRRKVMVLCDIGRASLLLLPAVRERHRRVSSSSRSVSRCSRSCGGRRRPRRCPNLVAEEQLSSANSLSLAASYGTFPIASIIFSLLAGFATVLGELDIISAFKVDQEALALIFDAMTFLVSAAIVYRLPIPRRDHSNDARIDWTETFREIKEGFQFVSKHAAGARRDARPRVRPHRRGRDDPARAEVRAGGAERRGRRVRRAHDRARVRRRDRRRHAAVAPEAVAARRGVLLRGRRNGRIPRAGGVVSSLAPAALFIGGVGACAGTTYVTGFTLLQENVSDELRGRTFATLYTVVRLCLLISLTISPLWADFWNWVTEGLLTDQSVTIGSYSYALPGCASRSGVVGSSRSSRGWWRGARSARRNDVPRPAVRRP